MPQAVYTIVEGTDCQHVYRRGDVDSKLLVHTHASRQLVLLPDASPMGVDGAYFGVPIVVAETPVAVLGLFSPRSRSRGLDEAGQGTLQLAAQLIHLRLVRVREIERREAAELALSGAREMATTARHAKSRFLSYLSHEIRTPMSGLLGLSQLLLGEGLSPEQRELVSGIQISGQTLLQTLSDVVELAKIDVGRLALENVEFSPHEVIETLATTWRGRANSRKLTLKVRIAGDVPRHVVGDPTRLRQMVVNLLSNAVNYTQRGGVVIEVSVAAELEEGWKLQVVVIDTGIGITEDEQKFLFNLLSDADQPGSAGRYSGAGLGLSLCKALSDLLGGDLRVESELGKGSSFHLCFPVKRPKDDAPRRPRVRRSYPQEPQSTWARVLLAEDNPESQILVRTILQRVGYQVDVVTNGREAVDAVIAEHYDLVLMDIEMPGMDGADAAQAIRNLEGPASRLPIIALTAHAMPGDRQRFLSQGMTGYVSKPIRVGSLREVVAEALERASEDR